MRRVVKSKRFSRTTAVSTHQRLSTIFAKTTAFNTNSARPTICNRMDLQNARTKHQKCMVYGGLSNVFWAKAVNTSVYELNQAPTSAVKEKTPQEAWSG